MIVGPAVGIKGPVENVDILVYLYTGKNKQRVPLTCVAVSRARGIHVGAAPRPCKHLPQSFHLLIFLKARFSASVSFSVQFFRDACWILQIGRTLFAHPAVLSQESKGGRGRNLAA